MSGITSIRIQQLESRVARSALAVLLLTSVHHAYGAYVYDTPWRLHVLFVSGFAAAVIIGSLLAHRKSTGVARETAFWVFVSVTFAVPIAIIGLFEGGYNHALKDTLYFAGASLTMMHRLFPPPTYELPSDVFFEVTGVLQLVLAVLAGYELNSLLRERWRRANRLSVAATATPGTGQC